MRTVEEEDKCLNKRWSDEEEGEIEYIWTKSESFDEFNDEGE